MKNFGQTYLKQDNGWFIRVYAFVYRQVQKLNERADFFNRVHRRPNRTGDRNFYRVAGQESIEQTRRALDKLAIEKGFDPIVEEIRGKLLEGKEITAEEFKTLITFLRK